MFGFGKPREDCLMHSPNRNLGRTSINVKQALSSLKCSCNLKIGIARLLPPNHQAEVAFQVNIHAVSSQKVEKGNFSKCYLHHWAIVLWRWFFLSQFDPVHPAAVWTLAVETHNSQEHFTQGKYKWARPCLGIKVQNAHMNLMYLSLLLLIPDFFGNVFLNLSKCWVMLANISLLRSSFSKCVCKWFTLCQCSSPGLYKDLLSTVKLNMATCLGIKFEASRTCGSILF